MIGLDKLVHICYNKDVSGDGTHQKKRSHEYANSNTKGATPIEKNVIVVDEQGKIYEATYPKRAKGLVKNGRARFVAENKICLACPPNENLEDKNMSENMNNIAAEASVEIKNIEITAEYALAQIEKILADTQHIYEALDALKDVHSAGPEDIGAQSAAQGMADVVRCRETTNQQLLAFYTKLLNDLMAPKKDPLIEKMELIRNTRLSMLRDLKEFYCEDELAEHADAILGDISSLCNDIYLTKN